MSLEQRFDRLESANRQWRVATIILGVLVAALVFTSRPQGSSIATAGAAAPELIRARRFEVVNEKGDTLVAIAAGNGGVGELSIYNAQKIQLVNLGGSEIFGGGLFLSDSKGRLKVVMTAPKDTGGVIRDLNGEGKPVVELTASGDGGGDVRVFNNHEKEIVTLKPDKTNSGKLGVSDAEGNEKRAFGVTP
jgi:hypothetical protein